MTKKSWEYASQYFSLQWCLDNHVVPIRIEETGSPPRQVATVAISDKSHLPILGSFIKNRLKSFGIGCRFVILPVQEISELLESQRLYREIDLPREESIQLLNIEAKTIDEPEDASSDYKNHPKPSVQIFYSQDLRILLALMFLSAGLYGALWSYRFWSHFKQNALNGSALFPGDSRIKPIINMLLGNIYLVGACRRIEGQLKQANSGRYRMWGLFCFCFLALSPVVASSLWGPFGIAAKFNIALAAQIIVISWIQINANRANKILNPHLPLVKVTKKRDFLLAFWGILVCALSFLTHLGADFEYKACIRESGSSDLSISQKEEMCRCVLSQLDLDPNADPGKVGSYCFNSLSP